MALWIKVIAATSNDLNSIPRTYMVRGKNPLLRYPQTSQIYIHACMDTKTCFCFLKKLGTAWAVAQLKHLASYTQILGSILNTTKQNKTKQNKTKQNKNTMR